MWSWYFSQGRRLQSLRSTTCGLFSPRHSPPRVFAAPCNPEARYRCAAVGVPEDLPAFFLLWNSFPSRAQLCGGRRLAPLRHVQVRFQLFLPVKGTRKIRCSIRAVAVAAPVSARNRHQLNSVAGGLAGVFAVRGPGKSPCQSPCQYSRSGSSPGECC